MAKKISIELEANSERIVRSLGLTTRQFHGIIGAVKQLEAEEDRLGAKTDALTRKIESLARGAATAATSIKSAFIAAGSGGGVSELLKNVADLNRKYYDLSKTAALTGQSFTGMMAGMKQLNAQTQLSIEDSAEFFRIVSAGTKGLRMTGAEVAKLGRTLSDEFGPTLQDVSGAFEKLAQLQEKDIFLFRRLNAEIKADDLGAYAARLTILNKASQEQIQTLFRTAYAMKAKGQASSEEQKKMLQYQRDVQKLTQTFNDLRIKIGQPLMDVFNKLSPIIQKTANWMGNLIDKNPKLIEMVGKLVMVAPILGSVSRGVGAIGSLASMAGLGRSLGTQANPAWVKVVGGLPGLGEGRLGDGGGLEGKRSGRRSGRRLGGLGGRASRSAAATAAAAGPGLLRRVGGGVGIGLAGMAVGYGGQALAENVGGKAGAGISAASRTAEYAITGAAIGSILPGLGTGAGAAIGGVIGLISSLGDLETALGDTEKEAEEARKAKEKELAEQEKLLRGSKLEQEAGIGAEHAMFAGSLAVSRLAQEQLMAEGMSKKDAEEEAKKAAAGSGSAAFFAAAKKAATPDKVMARSETLKKELTEQYGIEKANKMMKTLGDQAGFVTMQFEQMSLSNLMQETAQIKGAFDAINESLRTEVSLILETSGNAEKAQEILGRSLEYQKQHLAMLEQQRAAAMAIIGEYGSHEAALKKIADLKKNESNLNDKQRDQLDKLLAATASLSTVDLAILQTKKGIFETERATADTYESRLSLIQSELGLMESEAAIAKEMYLGAGPTLEFQIGMVNKAEEAKKIVQDEIALIKTRMAERQAEGESTLDLQKQLIAAQQKQNDLTRKQLEMTKNLREGYLDALTTMTNAEGTFAKFVLRKEMGMGELQRTFLAAGGMRTGMIGAGGAGPSVKWRAGGGPGALQFLSPEAFARRAAGYGEELGPQTMFPNVAAALAGTPLGQFGAQAPESGAVGMGGRAGPGITIQNPVQAAELRGIERQMEERIKKGEGTADLRARGEAIVKEAKGGTFEGQVLDKMDKIIAIMSGGKPPDQAETKPLQDAVEAGTARGQAAVEGKREKVQRQEASKQAAEMRKGTNLPPGSPTAAEDAARREAEKLEESEKIEQARFNEFARKFRSGQVEAGVDTRYLGIGKGGGPGARGTAFAGEPGKGMTVEGAEWAKEFTSEQVKAVSRRLGSAQESATPEVEIAPPDLGAIAEITKEIEGLREVQKQASERAAKAEAISGGIKASEVRASQTSALTKQLERTRVQQADIEKENVDLRKTAGEGDVGWGAKLIQEIEGVGGMLKDAAGGIGEAAQYSLRMAARTEGGPTAEEISKDYERESAERVAAREQDINKEQKAQERLVVNQIRKNALKKKEQELIEQIKKSQEEDSKAAQEAAFNEDQRTRAIEIANEEKNRSIEAEKKITSLSQQRDVAVRAAAAQEDARYKAIIKKADVAAKQANEWQLGFEPEKKAGIYADGKRQISVRQVSEQEAQAKAMIDELDKQMSDISAGINEAMKRDDTKKYEELESQYATALEKREEIAKRADTFKKGAEIGGEERMDYADNEFEQWQAKEFQKYVAGEPGDRNEFKEWQNSAEGQKQIEAMNKVHAAVKEGTKTQQEVGQAQVDAQKESGQNLRSTLEQQKIDVTPVVTSVNPACATAVAQTASTGGWISHMASGGRLPGFGGGDRVLAMLEPGEFVINKDSAKAFPGLLDAINKNRFQDGGMVGMIPSPSMARQGGSITPRFNISVRGDSAKTLVGSVSRTLSGLLNDMFVPQGTSGRLYDLGT